MNVKITVHGHVTSLLPGNKKEYEVEISEPSNISDIIQENLEVNPMVFASIVVDGEAVKRDYVVEDDCEVVLVSPTAGG